MAAAHSAHDDHGDHSHDDHDDHDHAHDDHAHEAVEEDTVRTPLWLPFVGIALLLFGAIYTYSAMHEPPAQAAAAQGENGASAAPTEGASAAPSAPGH